MAQRKKKPKGSKRAEKVQKRARKNASRPATSNPFDAQVFDDIDEFDDLDDSPIHDHRQIERILAQHSRSPHRRTESDLDRAQSIIYDAFEERDPEERLEMALEALDISPDCADAYVIMAEESESLTDATRYYEQGVEAGRRALGADFDRFAGRFWGVLETRPYMRARCGFAGCLWSLGRRDEAIGHFLELIKLNPQDNQGIRYLLAPRLIEMGRAAELRKLFAQYGEDSAQWLYSRALLEFRTAGEGRAADALLKQALRANAQVAKYLTGQRPVPYDPPQYYSLGTDEEARVYVAEASGAWKSVPGAAGWLRKISGVGLSEADSELPPIDVAGLRQLEQDSDEVWRVDVRLLPRDALIENDTELWSIFVLSDAESDVVATDVGDTKPTARMVWETLCTAMSDPIVGEPRRPGCLEFSDAKLLKQLVKRIQSLRIEAIQIEEDDELNERFAEIAKQLSAPADTRPLQELPQAPDEYWQIDCRQMGIWLPDDSGEFVRPWVVLVTSPLDNAIVEHHLYTEQPSLDDIWNGLEQGMRRPATGTPRRPASVQVRSADQRLTLERRLDPIGVACDSSRELDHWDSVYDGLARHMEGQRRSTPLSELPGVELAQLGSLFEACAEYFRAAPWRRVPSDARIELKCDLCKQKWDAVIIGQNGMMLGLALYEEGIGLSETLQDSAPDQAMMRASALSLTFGEQHELSPSDLDAAEQFGWPVATPEAYPTVFRIRPGSGLVDPTRDELSLLEAALRSVPEFVRSGEATLTKAVTLCDRTATVTMRWANEE